MVWSFVPHHQDGTLSLESPAAIFIRFPRPPVGKEHHRFAFSPRSGRRGNMTGRGTEARPRAAKSFVTS